MRTVFLWVAVTMILGTWLFCIATANRLIQPMFWRAGAVLALTFVACGFLVWAGHEAGWWYTSR